MWALATQKAFIAFVLWYMLLSCCDKLDWLTSSQVLLGFIVTSYMNAHVPTVEDPPKPPAAARKSLPPRQASTSRSPLTGRKATPPNRGGGGDRGAAGGEEKVSPVVRFRKALQRRSSFGDDPTR